MEKMRKRLMNDGPTWGQLPTSRPTATTLSSTGVSTTLATSTQTPAVLPQPRNNNSTVSSLPRQRDLTKMPSPPQSSNTRTRQLGQSHSTASAQAARIPHITSKGWSLETLLSKGKNFRKVKRVPASSPDLLHFIEEYECGQPLVIDGWQRQPRWRHDLFTPKWLLDNCSDAKLSVRNIHDRSDTEMSLPEFIQISRDASPFATPDETERFYGKDVECPLAWQQWLNESDIPSSLLPGTSNDLLQHLHPSEAVQSLMCYLGIGDTYTPCHKDLCASSGHNLLCFAEGPESKSFWFMTASSDADKVARFFQDELRQELDWETHVVMVEQLAKADFDVYIVEQKLGDLVLVPPRSCHQVVNYGGLTIKTSWSRMTVNGLATALYRELPIYRRVCRPEQYRIRKTIYCAVLRYTRDLSAEYHRRVNIQAHHNLGNIPEPPDPDDIEYSRFSSSTTTLASEEESDPERSIRDLNQLIELFDTIIREEYSEDHASMPHIISDPRISGWRVTPISQRRTALRLRPPKTIAMNHVNEDQDCNVICDFCGADIFQSFLECEKCDSSRGGFAICAGCYVEGRTCACEEMVPQQCRPFEWLLRDRNEAVKVLEKVSDISLQQLTMKELKQEDYGQLFQAAYILQKHRANNKDKSGTGRMCRQTSNPHPIPYFHGLTCALCHGSRCFRHLLGNGLHSADALLAQSQSNLHEQHLVSKNHYARLKRAGKNPSTSSNLNDRLVAAVEIYQDCRPANERFAKLGWYDLSDDILDYGATLDANVASAFDREATPEHGACESTRSYSTESGELGDPAMLFVQEDGVMDAHALPPSILMPPTTRQSATMPALISPQTAARITTTTATKTVTVSTTATTTLTVPRRHSPRTVVDYVLMPKLTKRTLPRSDGARKKARLADDDDALVRDDSAVSVVAALNAANSMRPMFMQQSLPRRKARPRMQLIVSPEPESFSSPDPLTLAKEKPRDISHPPIESVPQLVGPPRRPPRMKIRPQETAQTNSLPFSSPSASVSSLRHVLPSPVSENLDTRPTKRRKMPPGIRATEMDEREVGVLGENTGEAPSDPSISKPISDEPSQPEAPINIDEPVIPIENPSTDVVHDEPISETVGPQESHDPDPAPPVCAVPPDNPPENAINCQIDDLVSQIKSLRQELELKADKNSLEFESKAMQDLAATLRREFEEHKAILRREVEEYKAILRREVEEYKDTFQRELREHKSRQDRSRREIEKVQGEINKLRDKYVDVKTKLQQLSQESEGQSQTADKFLLKEQLSECVNPIITQYLSQNDLQLSPQLVSQVVPLVAAQLAPGLVENLTQDLISMRVQEGIQKRMGEENRNVVARPNSVVLTADLSSLVNLMSVVHETHNRNTPPIRGGFSSRGFHSGPMHPHGQFPNHPFPSDGRPPRFGPGPEHVPRTNRAPRGRNDNVRPPPHVVPTPNQGDAYRFSQQHNREGQNNANPQPQTSPVRPDRNESPVRAAPPVQADRGASRAITTDDRAPRASPRSNHHKSQSIRSTSTDRSRSRERSPGSEWEHYDKDSPRERSPSKRSPSSGHRSVGPSTSRQFHDPQNPWSL